MNKSNYIGKKGEELAAKYLSSHLTKNNVYFQSVHGTADLHFVNKGKTVDVEVKSCSEDGKFVIKEYQHKILSKGSNKMWSSNNVKADKIYYIFVWLNKNKAYLKMMSLNQVNKMLKGIKSQKRLLRVRTIRNYLDYETVLKETNSLYPDGDFKIEKDDVRGGQIIKRPLYERVYIINPKKILGNQNKDAEVFDL